MEEEKIKKDKLNKEKIIRKVLLGGGILIAIVLLLNTFYIVNTGEIAMIKRLGKNQTEYNSEGVNLKIPFIDNVTKINCKIQRSEQELSGATKDLQDINVYCVFNYKIQESKAVKLYSEVGKKYLETLMNPTINNIVKTTLSKYTAEESITKREEISNIIINEINNKLLDYGIEIKEFTLSNINFSEAYTQAIEDKQVAEQEAKKAELELEKVKAEANQKIRGGYND